MQIGEMHIEFKIGLDKGDSFSYANYEPEEIDIFLNKAQENYIKQRYSGNNPKRESIEETQKRRDDLRNITVNSVISSFSSDTNNKPNGTFAELPSDYWFMLQDEVTISYTDCNDTAATKRIQVKPVTHDRYNKVINDPFNKPDEDTVLRLPYEYTDISTPRVELIGDGEYTITYYYIRYLREPRTMVLGNDDVDPPIVSVNCELSSHTHREIIDLAVNMALENIESRRTQTQAAQVIRNE